MLYHFLKDMFDILRLRYKTPAEYLYTLPVIAAVLLLLGVINAANMSPLFGQHPAAIVFAVLLTVVKWLVLSRAMRAVLHYYNGAQPLPLWGFTLASEALSIPMLALFYIPQLAVAAMFYQVWIFWVQAIGFMRMGNVSVWKVAVGYILYFIGTLIIGSILLMLFIQAGWMDAEAINRQLQIIMQPPAS
ncbi:hypothetical protein [Neisseria sp. CCUG12390]|uniref:hypothetical protein n=1 Tax=Neisseria sp. CCUG12390 TaxID=3392035 RepID=UPI003A1029EC